MKPETPVLLVYDGDCPLCRYYVAAQQLQTTWGELNTLDARTLAVESPVLFAEIQRLGLEPEQGMLLRLDGHWLSGAEAVQMLAWLNVPNWRNRLWLYWFRSAGRARFSYPLLKAARSVLLKLLKIPPLPY